MAMATDHVDSGQPVSELGKAATAHVMNSLTCSGINWRSCSKAKTKAVKSPNAVCTWKAAVSLG